MPRPSLLWETRTQCKLLRAHCSALLRNRYDSGLLVAGALAVVLLAVVDALYQLLAPLPPRCPRAFYVGVGVPPGCESAFHTSMSFTAARSALGSICLLGVWSQRVFGIHFGAWRRSSSGSSGSGVPRRRRQQQQGDEDVNGGEQVVVPPADSNGAGVDAYARQATAVRTGTVTLSDVRVWGSGSAGWTLASSKQAWLEATGSVYANVALMLSTTLGITGLLAVINIVTALTEPGWRAGVSWAYACETCIDGGREEAEACAVSGSAPINMCFLAWHAKLAFPYWVAGQVVSLGQLTALTPLRVWDPVAVEAAQATGLRWLELLRVVHYPVALGAANAPIPIIAFCFMEFHVGPRILLELAAYSSVIFGTAQLIFASWILWTGARQQNANAPKEDKPKTAWQRLCSLPRAAYESLFLESAAGLNSKLQYQLMLIMFVFAAHISAYGILYYAVLFFFRVVILIVFAFTRDQQTDFKALRRDPNGAGFGLVVDVCMLAEALRRYLANEPPLEHIPTYKATVYRMEATMAVSYRWQLEEACICPGRALNMSRWQMERLVAALEDTSCFYVWVDRLSVPQYECELQNTLLSRMMATYASARETLVLRSLEDNGSRYHQRAWTLPEFVCSASPRICTQERENNGGEAKSDEGIEAWPANGNVRSAVVRTEEMQVAQVREFYLSHLGHCRPLWLHPNGEVNLDFSLNELEVIWEMYWAALGQLLNCSIPEDRIRAVYPLFFCIPVDNHDELVSLVDEVANQLAAKKLRGAEAARQHYFEIMGAGLVDEEDDSEHVSSRRGMVDVVFRTAASAVALVSARALTALQAAMVNASDRFRQPYNMRASARCGSIDNRFPMLDERVENFPNSDILEAGEWEMAAVSPRGSSFRENNSS